MSNLTDTIVETAVSQIGVREIGTSNTGKEVNAYLASTGLGPGYPWCAAFVYWCYEHGLKKLGLPNPLPKSAYVPDFYNWGKSNGVLESNPSTGDLFVVYHSSQKRYAHIGIVRSVSQNTVKTVEGNTNLSGSRSGIGVFSLTRNISSVRYIRALDMVKGGSIVEHTALLLLGDDVLEIPLMNGKTYVPLRAVAEYFDHSVGWKTSTNTPTIDGEEVGLQVALRDGVSYVYSRDLAEDLSLRLTWDPGRKAIEFHA